jgi:hypothetical protein
VVTTTYRYKLPGPPACGGGLTAGPTAAQACSGPRWAWRSLPWRSPPAPTPWFSCLLDFRPWTLVQLAGSENPTCRGISLYGTAVCPQGEAHCGMPAQVLVVTCKQLVEQHMPGSGSVSHGRLSH